MSGWTTVSLVHDIERQLDQMGLSMARGQDYNKVTVIPKPNMPTTIYTNGTTLFSGTLEELDVWLWGIRWAREYDRVLFGKTHDDKRLRKEQDARNRQLVEIIKK